MKGDIQTREDIVTLVDRFYARVKEDELLGPVFVQTIGSEWDNHLEKMYRFWETVLLDRHTYSGSPFLPHARLGLTDAHFERWLRLFHQTLEHFEGPKKEEAAYRAEKMALMFRYKIASLRERPVIPIS